MKQAENTKRNRIFLGSICLVLILSFFAYFYYQYQESKKVEICSLKTEYTKNPIGIDVKSPRFSWQMESKEQGKYQTAYRLVVAETKREFLFHKFLYDTGKIVDDKSVGITLKNIELEPESRYYWKLWVWDEKNRKYTSKQEAYFETGLMNKPFEDVTWISAKGDEGKKVNVMEDEYYYTVGADIRLLKAQGSLVFGYDKEHKFFRIMLDPISNQELVMQVELGEKGIYQEDLSTFFPTREDFIDNYISVKAEVKKDKLAVFLNDTFYKEYEITPRPLGRIGVIHESSYVVGGDAYYDNFYVKNKNGDLILKEDFTDINNTIFSPEYYEIKDGQLSFDFGILLTPDEDYENAAPMFRKEFETEKANIKSARLYASALGIYDFYINGQKISSDYFNPGKLAYAQTMTYQTFDVTNYVKQGKNAIGAYLGHGWYDRAVGAIAGGEAWGDKLALIAKLVITYKDGRKVIIETDETWKYYDNGPIRQNDMYNGQMYDANYEVDGWSEYGLKDENWKLVHCYTSKQLNVGKMTTTINPAVKNTMLLQPISVSEPRKGTFVYDFGQNFTGICRIQIKGKKGQQITLRHAEEINQPNLSNRDDKDGMLWTFNLLGAKNTDRFVLKGIPEGEVFEPNFVFRGFRYVEVTGIEKAIPLEDIEGLVLSSDLEETGTFECSEERVNRLYQNTVWSQKSNFVSSPMDCPQRDERHGWTGDAQIFARTASYHANVYPMMQKFLQDMRDIQAENGAYPDMAPRNFNADENGVGGDGGVNGWGDAGVIITWQMYQQYGDVQIIEENYEAMCKWIQYLLNTSENYIRNRNGFGDHLATVETPVDLVNTAWCAYSSELLSKMATVIGKEEDAKKYRGIFEAYKKAWNEEFVSQDGMTHCWTESSYVLGLQFNLFENKDRVNAGKHLLTCIEANENHLSAGFAAISFLNPVLSDMGYSEKAYELLYQDTYPSWLYSVDRGATTIYERWYGRKDNEDGTYSLSGSLNHYAFGTIAEWMYRYILGIDRVEENPGFKQFVLRPHTDEKLKFAKGSYDSMYGKIESSWERTEEGMKYRFVIPANTSAILYLPQSDEAITLQSGTYEFMEKK